MSDEPSLSVFDNTHSHPVIPSPPQVSALETSLASTRRRMEAAETDAAAADQAHQREVRAAAQGPGMVHQYVTRHYMIQHCI